MPEWVTCPSCGLKHTARPDGACPRCHQAIAAEPGPPETPVTEAAPGQTMYVEHPLQMTEDQPAVPSSAKAAGLVLIANGLLQLVATLVTGVGQGPVAFGGLFSVAIDFVVGGYLLADNEQALKWAKWRVGLGLLFLPFVQYMTGGFIVAGFQAAFSAGLLLLLLGTPGLLRLGMGVAACGLCLLLQLAGLFAIGVGTNPLSRYVLSSQAEGAAVKVVDGKDFKYRLQTTGDGWYIRKADLAKKDNPLADRWLINPGREGHVLVLVERVGPTDRINMDTFARVIMDNARNAVRDLTLVEQKTLENAQGPGRLLHTRGKVEGNAVEFYYGLYAREPEVYQVVAFTRQRNFGELEPQLYEWVSSLETPGYASRYSTFQQP
jgi:hypothetical protein